jgi:hypothetical protein
MRISNSRWIGAPRSPRDWQKEALPIALDAIESGDRGIIRAIMGAGKSILISEVCRSCTPDRDEAVIITAPTQKLVRQLSATVAERIGPFRVGQYFAERKEFDRPVIVACVDSTMTLAERLADHGISCALWIADEAHRTEADTIHSAMQALSPERALGFTATPYRASSGESLTLWDRLIFDYGPREAVRDGVVVPWKTVFADDARADIDETCIHMISSAIADGLGPGVVNAVTIEDAEAFAVELTARGIRAEPIHSFKSSREQDAMLARLQRGDIDCVVHVSLLQEGVDMPWLKWLCMRRPVKSRVRFAQEVGRVLRAFDGKEYATVFDPHCLFDALKLDYEAVLGMAFDDEDKPPVELALDAIEDAQQELDLPDDGIRKRPRVLDAYGAYLRQLILAFYMSGYVDNSASTKRAWQADHITEKQAATIWSMKWTLHTHFIPEIPWRHRVALAHVVERRQELSKGHAADLLTILFALRQRRAWPELAEKMSTAIDAQDTCAHDQENAMA